MLATKILSALVATSLLLCSPVSAGPIGDMDMLADVELVTYDCRFCGSKLCPEDSATKWHLRRVETEKCHRFRSRTEPDRTFGVYAFSNVVVKKGCESGLSVWRRDETDVDVMIVTLFNDIHCSEDSWQFTADYKHDHCFERAGGYDGLKAFRVSCDHPGGFKFSKSNRG